MSVDISFASFNLYNFQKTTSLASDEKLLLKE